jgi:uncharacterized membrane protein YgcG
MSNNTITRFTIHKDAHEYLTKEVGVSPARAICAKDQFSVDYTWDAEFKKYFRGNFQKVEEFSKYYASPELFLQNIHWEAIFKSAEHSLEDILTKAIKEQWEDSSLVIVNAHPMEMVVMGEILRSLGYMNTVYNFNRNPIPNSIAKTMEAYLLLASWKNSPYFQEQSEKVQTNIRALAFKIQGDRTFFLFDENNTLCPYEHAKIDNYLKTQIGFKEPKNVYRLDKYPTMEFLLQKGIKKVIALDTDNDLGWGIESYRETIKEAKNGVNFTETSYFSDKQKNPGYYEDYLILKNKEYTTYRQTIEEKTLNSFPGLAEKKKSAETPQYIAPELQNKKNKNTPGINTASGYEDRSIVPYLVLFPVIFIAFLASDLGVFKPKVSTTGSGSTNTGTTNRSGNSFFYWGWDGGSSWTSGGSAGSSISSSPSSSSSIIKSFGGGWFSKGGSSGGG